MTIPCHPEFRCSKLTRDKDGHILPVGLEHDGEDGINVTENDTGISENVTENNTNVTENGTGVSEMSPKKNIWICCVCKGKLKEAAMKEVVRG